MGELKGKLISVGGAKDITRIFVEQMLLPNGVKPGEFDMTFAGATSARFSALQAGAVDAAILTKWARLESNQHALAGTRPSTLRVCQFRHEPLESGRHRRFPPIAARFGSLPPPGRTSTRGRRTGMGGMLSPRGLSMRNP